MLRGGTGRGRVLFLLILTMAGEAPPRSAVPVDDPGERIDRIHGQAFREGEQARVGGDFERSAERFAAALAASIGDRNRAAEALCLGRLGLCLWNLGRVKEAETRFLEAAVKAEASGPAEVLSYGRGALEIIRLYERGKACRLSNDLETSLEAFQEAVTIGRRIGSEEFVAKCLRQMTGTQWSMNDLGGFLAGNQEGLEIATRLNLKVERGRCLNNLGLYFWKATDYSKALRYFQQALTISTELRDSRMKAECLSNMGIIYKELGDYVVALECFNGAYALDRELNGITGISIDLTNLGSVYRDIANLHNDKASLDKALAYYQDCLIHIAANESKQIEISCLNNIGTIKTDLNLLVDALRVFREAIKKAEHSGFLEETASLNSNLGEVFYKKREFIKASRYIKKAITIALKLRLSHVLWEAYYRLGRCLEMSGDPDAALTYYHKSVDVIDSIRSRILLESFKTGFSRNKLGVFESLLSLLFKLQSDERSGKRLEEMFMVIEKAKARAFLECLGEVRIDPRDGLTSGLRERERAVSKEISDLVRALSEPGLDRRARATKLDRLERAEEESLRLVSEMKGELVDRAGLFSPEIYSTRAIQEELLDRRTALIEYFLGDDRSYMFFITRDKVRLFALPPREDVERSLRGYLRALSVPDAGGFSGRIAAERIAAEILPPLSEPSIAGIERLLIIPDGILYYLPFETLRPPGIGGSGFLVERYETSYAPSSSSLAFLRKKPAGGHRKSLLALGAPELKTKSRTQKKGQPPDDPSAGDMYQGLGFDLGPLPFARREILDIAGHFPRPARDIMLGSDATEGALKARALNDYDILHFACHGLLDERVPFRSALVLSTGRDADEDGFLQAREVYNLGMDADLVVLSACQTGRGRLEKGEGLLGLPRMFFYAGSRSVVSSLWHIGDRSTARFMDVFYEHLSRGMGKAQALRQAKIQMLRSRSQHPFHWAAFLLNGDFGPVVGIRSRAETVEPAQRSMMNH